MLEKAVSIKTEKGGNTTSYYDTSNLRMMIRTGLKIPFFLSTDQDYDSWADIQW